MDLGRRKEKGRVLRHDWLLLFPRFEERTEGKKKRMKMGQRRGPWKGWRWMRRLREQRKYESLHLFILKPGSCSGLKEKVMAGCSSSSSIIKLLYSMKGGGRVAASSSSQLCLKSFFICEKRTTERSDGRSLQQEEEKFYLYFSSSCNFFSLNRGCDGCTPQDSKYTFAQKSFSKLLYF